MTSKEAFEKWYGGGKSTGDNSYSTARMNWEAGWQAALEWAASQREPVAWYDPVSDLPNNKRTKWSTEPLYLHPAPIPEGWKLVPVEPGRAI